MEKIDLDQKTESEKVSCKIKLLKDKGTVLLNTEDCPFLSFLIN